MIEAMNVGQVDMGCLTLKSEPWIIGIDNAVFYEELDVQNPVLNP